MAINYSRVNWDTTKSLGPTNLNNMDLGIKKACDGVDIKVPELSFLGWNVPDEMPLKNTIDSQGNLIQKVGRVDMGACTWAYNTSNSFFYTSVGNGKDYSVGNVNIYCTKYTTINSTSNPSNGAITVNSGFFRVKDTSYTDATTFRSAMVGTFLYYELATPITHKVGSETVLSSKEVEFLGWSVPSACPIQNYVDSDGKFHQRVGRVNLGSLSWSYDSDNHFFYAYYQVKGSGSNSLKANLYCSIYSNASYSDIYNGRVSKSIGASSTGGTLICVDVSYSDATTFKNSLANTFLYYELATENVISVGEEVGKIKTKTVSLNFSSGNSSTDISTSNNLIISAFSKLTSDGRGTFCVPYWYDNGYYGIHAMVAGDGSAVNGTLEVTILYKEI